MIVFRYEENQGTVYAGADGRLSSNLVFLVAGQNPRTFDNDPLSSMATKFLGMLLHPIHLDFPKGADTDARRGSKSPRQRSGEPPELFRYCAKDCHLPEL